MIVDEAPQKAFPVFSTRERLSGPGNSSPHVRTRPQLVTAFQGDAVRLGLLDELDRLISNVEKAGAVVPLVMIGGGFVRRIGTTSPPKDLDGVAFYRINPDMPAALDAILNLSREGRARKLDLRVCPLDGNPIVMIKTIAFCTTLYSKQAGSMLIENGLILYDRNS